MDLGSLTTVVANSAYINARGSFDGSNLEALLCEGLQETLDMAFQSVCVEQPIGKRLFLEAATEYHGPCRLWRDIEEYDLAEESDRAQKASRIIQRYLVSSAKLYCLFLTPETVTQVKEALQMAGDSLFAQTLASVLGSLHLLPGENVPEEVPSVEVAGDAAHGLRLVPGLPCAGEGGVRRGVCLPDEGHGETVRLQEAQQSRFIVSLAYAFQTKDELCLIMTIMNGGDLKRVLLHMEHLHQKRIIYRDLKPENVLLDNEGNVRVSDLGLAVELKKDQTKIKGYGRTPGFIAPELLKGKKYDTSVDYFTLGVTMFEFMAAKNPFRERGEKVEKEELKECIMTGTVVYPETFSENGKSICSGLLEKQVDQRPGFKNGTCDEIRAHPFFSGIHWRRLDAGILLPLFVPDSKVVYAKDLDAVGEFSSVKGVGLDDPDRVFFNESSSGNIPIPWQEEMIETGIYGELNVWGHAGAIPNDLRRESILEQPKSSTCCLA
ncbi:unnamed protein product, partial [Coregonus sp. 'balchen']